MNLFSFSSKIKDIAESVGNPEFCEQIISECKEGKAHFFGFDDCFVILKVTTIDDCACVNVECAYSERPSGFKVGFRFVSARAAEIGAKYITFSTANKGLISLAERCGWAKIEQGPIASDWIIEL